MKDTEQREGFAALPNSTTNRETQFPQDVFAHTGSQLWPALAMAFTAAFVCFLFTCSASVGLCVLYGWTGLDPGPGVVSRLMLKAILSGGMIGFALCGAFWTTKRLPVPPVEVDEPAMSCKSVWGGLISLLLLAALLVFPRLHANPLSLPDELHHLTVARNLSEYGLYATGHPAVGFKAFDSHDSVGPTVIGPVALAFKFFGPSLVVGRSVMACFFLAFCCSVYIFMRPVFGSGTALLGVALSMMAAMSAYLGRTLYGEVPALMFILLGLAFWRVALNKRGMTAAGFLAGLAFGLAVITKTILVLALFPILGALLYDVLTGRRIRLQHLVMPAAGTFIVLCVWSVFQIWHGGGHSARTEEMLIIYQHFLMFGLKPLKLNLFRVWQLWGPAFIVAACALPGTVAIFAHKRYDPPSVILCLVSVFFMFWWLFFTPGQLVRYAWYSVVVLAMFVGPLLCRAVESLRGGRRRFLWAVAICLILLPSVVNMKLEIGNTVSGNQMKDVWNMSEYIGQMPAEADVVTTFFPVTFMMNFLNDRHVPTVTPETVNATSHEHYIVDSVSQPSLWSDETRRMLSLREFGRYAVYSRTKRDES